MEQILYIRETIISLYKRYETIILFMLKLFAGIIIFSYVNNIGYERGEFARFVKPPMALPFTLLMGTLFCVLPVTLSYGLIIICVTIQLSAYTEIALVVTLLLLCVLFFYARLAPKESALILATVFAHYFHLEYAVPLLAGLYFSMSSIIPITIGVCISTFIPVIKTLIASSNTAGLNIMEMPATFSELYASILVSISSNQQWIFTSFIFAMVVIVVYVVSRLSVDYSKDMAIGLGAVLNIISFIIAALMGGMDVGILSMIFFTLLSAGIVWLIRFFDIVLDYQRAERVQFEDEENYYYVKIIPKVILTKRKRVVRRIRPQEELEEFETDR